MNNIALCVLFAKILIYICKKTQVIGLYYQIIEGEMQINLQVGKAERQLSLPFNQTLDYIWYNHYTQHNVNDSFEVLGNTLIEVKGKLRYGKSIREVIRFELFNSIGSFLMQFKISINNNDTTLAQGQFGFAFKFDDTKYSLIHQLKERKLIDHLSYSISRPDSFNGGIVYLGGASLYSHTSYRNASCKVDSIDHYWGCKLKAIKFNLASQGEVIYNNTFISYFQASEEYIYVPKAFFQFLLDRVFSLHLHEKNCKIIEDNRKTVILCTTRVIESMAYCTFVFGNNGLKWRMDSLFTRLNRLDSITNMLRTFYMQSLHSNTDQWIFGSTFITEYEMLFDYEKEAITFVTLKEIEVYNDVDNEVRTIITQSQNDKLRFCCIIIYILCIIGIFNIVVIKTKISIR